MVRHVAREMYGLYHLIITHNHSNFEFTSVLNFLNAGKAPGLDCICPEFLLRHKMFLKCLSELYFKKCPVNKRIQHDSCDKFLRKARKFFKKQFSNKANFLCFIMAGDGLKSFQRLSSKTQTTQVYIWNQLTLSVIVAETRTARMF